MKNKGKNQSRVIVTVNDEALPKINQVASELRKKGMTVEEVMPMTGVITGSCPSDKMTEMQNVAGIMSVEKELTITLPPADSDLQ